MAVQIPVYIDIQGAFNRAAAEIPKEMPKLERAISAQALKIQFDGKSLRSWLTDSTLNTKQLQSALGSIRREFDAVVSGTQKARKGMNVDNLIKSYALLEQRITGTLNQTTVLTMKAEATIGQIQAKIVKLQATLSKATPGSDMFHKTNYELQLQTRRLAEVNAQLIKYKVGVDTTSTSLLRQGGIVRQLTGYFSGLYAVHTVIRFVKQIRDVTGELEYQRVALGHMLRDREFANELFEKTIAAAQESPFRIKQLVTYTKQLAAYRIEEDKLFDTTRRLADISAGLGVDMNRLILAYGQVRAASVLRGQELRQFTEAGIPLVEELAKKFSKLKGEMVSTADVFKLISERAVPFEYIKEIFEEMTDAGGMFYKMQQEQAKTLKGRWDKLKDTYDKALMSLGDSDTFQKWNDTVLNILNKIANNLRGIVRAVNAASVGWIAYKIATSNAAKATLAFSWTLLRNIKNLYKAGGAILVFRGILQSLKRTLISIKNFFVGNWFGLAVSGVLTLVTYLRTFRKEANETEHALSDMAAQIEAMKLANEKLEHEMGLINKYRELSEVESRTSAQNELLAQTMEALKELFPDIADKIGDENTALKDQVQLLEDNARLRREMAVNDARAQLSTQEQLIRGMEDEKEALYQRLTGARILQHQAELSEKQGGRWFTTADGLPIYKSAEKLKEETLEAAKNANDLEQQYADVVSKLEQANKEAEKLRELIDPSKKTKDWQEWQNQLKRIQTETLKPLGAPVFSPEEIGAMTSVYDLFNKLKKRSKDLEESLKGMREALAGMKKDTPEQINAYDKMVSDIERVADTKKVADAIAAFFGFDFSKAGPKTAYEKPAFLISLENQIKFMKDFKKGYDELKNYLGSQGAFSEEMGIMNLRGKALGLSSEEQSMAAENLSEWYKQVREKAFKHLQRTAGVHGSLEDFLSQKITGTSNRAKMLRDFQSFLQSLWDAQTDIDTSKMKKTFEDALKEISEKVRRSETAKSFYDKILGLSGSESVATNLTVSVYGESGQDLKQNIQDELLRAFRLDPQKLQAAGKNLGDTKRALFKAIGAGNTKALRDLSKYVVDANMPNVQEILGRREKEDADAIQHYFDTFVTTMSAYEQELILEGRRDQGKEVAKKFGLPGDAVDRFIDQAIAKAYFDELRGTYAWTKAFENLEGVSTETIRNILRLMDALQHSSDLSPTEKRELANARERAEAVLAQRNAYEGLVKAYDRLSAARGDLNKLEDKGLKYKADGKTLTDDYIEALDREQKALKDIGDTAGEITSEIEAVTESTRKLVSAFASSEDASRFNEQMDNLSAILSGAKDATVGITRIVANPADIQGWIMGATGLAATVAAIANAAYAAKIRRANNLIKEQQELLDSLSEAYDHLQAAAEKAFNSDYITNYQSRLANLQAQEAAYLAQAAAEREKGKKADEDQIKQYERSAREAADAIAEMSEDLQQHFLGTDLTSAARDFASAWIDAYKEFGSTTDAIKEKFRDMITGMVTESLAAQVVQRQLKPIFDYIDGLSGDGVLSVSDAAEVANMTKQAVGSIDLGLTNLMNALSGAGINLRTMGTGLTGISKDIQSASEESILGLAAGVNTQNFYMSQINANVIRIVEMMGGEPRSGQAPGQSDTGAGPTYQDQMLQYARNLPQMASDMAQIRNLLDKVIVKGSNYSVRVS